MKELRSEGEDFAMASTVSSWADCRLLWKSKKFALEGQERQRQGEAELGRVISHCMGMGSITWKHLLVLNRGKCVFTQHTVRLPNLLPGVVGPNRQMVSKDSSY